MTKIYRVGVLGSGAWGVTVGNLFSQNVKEVLFWDRSEEVCAKINSGLHPVYEVKLGQNLKATCNIQELKAMDLIIVAVPAQAVRSVLTEFSNGLDYYGNFLSIAKGIENETLALVSSIIKQHYSSCKVAVLSGPNFASEIAKKLPAASVIAAEDESFAAQISELIFNDHFRIYTSKDVIGVQVCGAMKNVIAIAAGITKGLELGENARATLITRSLVEISKVADLLGGSRETVFGLAGLGDLILTCSSESSRNFELGLKIAKSKNVQADLLANNKTVEGVMTAKSIKDFASKFSLDLPICLEVAEILEGKIDAVDAVKKLISRNPKKNEWC